MNPEVVTAEPPSAAPWEGGPVHVLHVAPHATDVERTRHHLLGHGARFAVDGTSSGAECLARLSREVFDVLLLGDRAADMTGPELLRAVRARRPRLPVVLLLRERDEQATAEGMKLGVFDWLVEGAGDLAKLPLVLENAAARQRMAFERAALAGQTRLFAALRSGLAVDELLGRLTGTACDLLQVEWGVVLLLENADSLVPRAWSDGMPRALAGMRFPARTGEWEALWSSPAPLRLEPIAVSGPWSVAPVLAEIDPAVAVPMVAHGRPLGALLVAAPRARHFGPADEAALRMLADLGSVAVENHLLTGELVHAQRLSTVGRMVAGVAHELNNPLAVIMGTLDLLRHEPLAERFAERLGRVSGQAQRAVKIVRMLLAFARKRPSQRTTVDVNELLADMLELAAYDLKRADVRVVRDLSEELPAVSGDPDQLQQVFTNLFLNACHAMRETHGEGTLTVTTGLDPATDRVVVTVADDGPGISPEHLAHVFEPFFTTKAEGQGTGLGLAICRRIVENHGGRISVQSRPGLGARFTVELPAARESGRPEGTSETEASPPSAGVLVLVVEDEPLVGDMVQELLVLDGHEVDRATNGREALERLARRAYALIVSDVRMPDLGGPAFYRELLRVDPALARRVVFVTGDVVSADTRRFLEETGLPWVEKPFAVTDFQSAVRRALASA